MTTTTRLLCLMALSAIAPMPAAQAQQKPNVVYILVDNWGWGDVSVQGSSTKTPRIDRLPHPDALPSGRNAGRPRRRDPRRQARLRD